MHDVALTPLLVSALIFALTYIGIFSGRVHRTIVGLVGAVAMIALGSWFSFYDMHKAVEAIDFNTITLLLGMMIVVGLFKDTGFFQYMAIRAAKLARGRPWLLLVYLGVVTSLISMVLDNVTTIIIMVPVTISIADIMGISPLPFLVSEVLLSNIGGVATLIGDPPNILIGSAAGLTFTDFLVHLAPIVLVAWIIAQGILLFLFRSILMRKPESIDHLMRMDESQAIIDRLTTARMLKVLGVTILLFLVHERIGLEPGLVALIGACLGLLWIRPNIDKLLSEIHWEVLLFFMSLFVIVGGLEAGGILTFAGRAITQLVEHGMLVTSLVILWVSAIASGVLSNVPFTIAILPILKGLAIQGIAVGPLWWALALGVGFGGNMTPIGAASNVFVVSLSNSIGEPLTFRQWLRSGSLVAVASCAVASAAFFIAFELGLL